ncbi:MAG: cation:proton antiporter [Actinomycetota bacterium]
MENATPLIELGLLVVGLAVLARTASRLSIPAIPLYLLAGLAFGEGGVVPLVTTAEFVELGAEIGLILLLFMLGLEYSARELVSTLKRSYWAGILNLVLNFTPGFIAALLLDWGYVAAVVLGGVTYTSSSGIVSKLLYDLGRIGNRETPIVLSLIVMEDLAMAVYLPLLAGLLIGGLALSGLVSALVAVIGVILLLTVALKVGVGLSRIIFSQSDEALLLTILGLTLAVAGAAELIQVSAAVAALLLGIVLSGPAAQGARELLSPLRDLFAALFFVFFGLSVDPAMVPQGLAAASVLALLTAITKFFSGWWAARRAGIGAQGSARAGATLIARGEFSIAIATVAVAEGLEPGLGPLAVAYVLLLAIVGPALARLIDPLTALLLERGGRVEKEMAG